MKKKVILALLVAVGVTTFGNSGISAFADASGLSNIMNDSTGSKKSEFYSLQEVRDFRAKLDITVGSRDLTKNHYNLVTTKTQDGGFLVAYTVYNSVSGEDIYLEKFNSSCKSVWNKTLDSSSGYVGLSALEEDSDGNIYLIGYSQKRTGMFATFKKELNFPSQSTFYMPFIAKIDSTGTVKEGRILISTGGATYVRTGVVKEGDGIYLTIRSNGGNIDGKGIDSFSVIKLDFNLNHVANAYTLNTQYSTNIVVPREDGSILLVTGESGNIRYEDFSNDLNKINNYTQSSFINKVTTSFTNSKGEIFVAGYNGKNTYIVRLDGVTEVDVWHIHPEWSTAFEIKSIIEKETHDGYYLVGNTTESRNDLFTAKGAEDILIVETDSDFNIIREDNIGGKYSDKVLNANLQGDKLYFSGISKSTDFVPSLYSSTYYSIIAGNVDLTTFSRAADPTVEKLDDSRISIKDNNADDLKDKVYYRIKSGDKTKVSSIWVEYTEPIVPSYDENGNFEIEVFSITSDNSRSNLVAFKDFNEDYSPAENASNVDVLFTLKDTLSLKYEDTSVDFGKISGLTAIEATDKVTMTISSSKQWDMTIKVLTDFIGQNTGNVVSADNLNAKVNEEEYVKLERGVEKELLTSQPLGYDISTQVGFKLDNVAGSESDTYKITTKVKLTQK